MLVQGETVTAAVYTHQLQQVAIAVREKRRKRSAVTLLHDDARSHVVKSTQAKLHEPGWDVLPHPPYSPDIAPSDYHLTHPLESFLAKRKFVDYDLLAKAIADFFDSQNPEFWEEGINDLPMRWQSVVDNNGEYVVA